MIINDYHLGPQEVDLSQVEVLVCDIDGTIADLTHRRHYITTKPKNYKAFEATIYHDTLIKEVAQILWDYRAFDYYGDIILCSGRGEQNRDVTEDWLDEYEVPYDRLYMRKAKDYRKDYIVKAELKDQILKDYGKIDLVLDDRDQVVKMWRDAGIRCIQVADGDF